MGVAKSVLHIQKVAGIAGSENHLLTLLPRLSEFGFPARMMVLKGPGDRPEDFVERMQDRGVATEVLAISGHFDPALPFRVGRRIRELQPAVVHTHLFHADLYGTVATRLSGRRRLVSTKHGYDPWRAKRRFALLDRAAARLQDRIIAISAGLADWLCETERLPPRKIRVVHYAIDAVAFQVSGSGGAAVQLKCSRPVVGTVSRLLAQKGIDVLIDSFALCRERHPGASLVIVGDGPQRPQLEARAHEAGVAGNVYFLGYRADVSTILPQFDVFALPTLGEGFGLVLLEAMCWGIPVVASRVTSVPEIVIDHETGLLVPPRDRAALAAALLELLGDADLRRHLGAAGRRRAVGEFTVDKMVRATVEVYESVLRSSSGHRSVSQRKDE